MTTIECLQFTLRGETMTRDVLRFFIGHSLFQNDILTQYKIGTIEWLIFIAKR